MGPAQPTLDTNTRAQLLPFTLRLSEIVHTGFHLLQWLPREFTLHIFTCPHMTSLVRSQDVVGRGTSWKQ